MTPHETEKHLQAALRGEQTAYCRLFEAFSPSVFSTAQRLTGRTEVAEELTQDVFLQAFKALGSYDSRIASFHTWLQRIAYNAAVSHLRRQPQPEAVLIEEDLAAADSLADTEMSEVFAPEDEDIAEALVRAVETLPPEDRHLLTLYYYENRTLQEISYVMQISTAALSLRLKKIRKKIHATLTTQTI